MKSKFTYIGLLAILISACSTGGYVSSPYTDDIYYDPSDETPTLVAASTKSAVYGFLDGDRIDAITAASEKDNIENTTDEIVTKIYKIIGNST